MSDSEDYDSACGGPIILTEEDSARLDALPACHILATSTLNTMSSSSTVLRTATNALKSASPFQRFRPNGRLSVTDLVSPIWCEVQFEYGLQQQRSRKLEYRPQTFITRNGKEIKVEHQTAVVNDATLKGGHAVHSTLEREIHPNRVKIEVQSEEELWARKFLDMLACIQTLSLSGICREFPVVGFVHGQLVAGIIDEIKRSPCPDISHTDNAAESPPPSPPLSQKRSRGRPRKSLDPQPNGGTSNIPDNPNPSLDLPPKVHQQRHCLFISDSKTRFSRSLPSHSATISSRLQLMLYRNLLNDFVSLSNPFDFDKLWQRLRVDPLQTFSAPFLAQILPLLGRDSDVTCLRDMEHKWTTALTQLDITTLPVHEQLTVVYRLRDHGGSKQFVKRKKSRPSSSSGEDEHLQKAILESIQPTTTSPPCEQSVSGEPAVLTNEKGLYADLVEVRNNKFNEQSTVSSQSQGVIDKRDLAVGDIIGQIQFNHDAAFLDSNIDHILDWWYGKREPVGVPIEEANRCNTCEYISGCEWREKRAMELLTG